MHNELAEEQKNFKSSRDLVSLKIGGLNKFNTCEKGEKMAQVDQHKAFSWSID
jgi:hypothetical protein